MSDFTDLFINIMLISAYVLIGLGALLAIVLPLIKISNPKSLIKSGVGLLALAVIFVVAYVISGDEVTSTYAKFGIDPTQSKVIGGVLITMYFMLILVILSIIYSEISKAFR